MTQEEFHYQVCSPETLSLKCPEGTYLRVTATSLEMQDTGLVRYAVMYSHSLVFLKQILQFGFVNVYIQAPGCYNEFIAYFIFRV